MADEEDRAFVVLQQVLQQLQCVEGTPENPGFWREYEGGVTDWITQSKRAAQINSSSAKTATATPQKASSNDKNTAQPTKDLREQLPKKKLSYKEQRELDGLPAMIQQLESQQKAITQELFDGTLYTTNARRAAELNARNSKIEEELMAALQRWETLSA